MPRGPSLQKIAIGLGGIVLGVVIQNFIDSQFRLVSALVGFMALGIITILLILQDRSSEWENITAAQNAQAEQIEKQLRLLIEKLSRGFADMRNSLGLSVQVQLLEELNKQQSVEEDIVSVAMRNATRKLLVADIEAAQGVIGTTTRSDLRKEYLCRLMDRARDSRRPLEYRRLVQVSDPSQPVKSAITDPLLLEHCREMCQLYSTEGRVSFCLAPRIFPYSWIIVDDEIVVLELYRYRHAHLPTFERSILVRDPQGSFVEAFMSIWRELAGQQQNRWPNPAEFE